MCIYNVHMCDIMYTCNMIVCVLYECNILCVDIHMYRYLNNHVLYHVYTCGHTCLCVYMYRLNASVLYPPIYTTCVYIHM